MTVETGAVYGPLIPENETLAFELTVLSVANLLGETIWRVYNSSSVQSLF